MSRPVIPSTIEEVDLLLEEYAAAPPERRSSPWWSRVDQLLDRRLVLVGGLR